MAPPDPGDRWLTAPDVGTLIGRGERSAREWLDRYDIPYRDSRPRRWSEPAILARLAALGERPQQTPEPPGKPPENALGKAPERPGGQDEPIEATFRTSDEPAAALVPLAPMLDQLRGLGEQLTTLAGRNEALALEAGQLRERTTQQAATIAELRRRAEAAEGERDALRLQLAEATVPPVVVVAPPGPPQPQPAAIPIPTAPQDLWRRLRRALRGR